MHCLLIYLILVFSFFSITSSCFFTPTWKLYVINGCPDNIVTHVRSKDDDLGNHIVPSYGEYYWTFCDRFDRTTRFDAEFWWGEKYQCLDVFGKNARSKCERFGFGTESCFWLVRPDGFYISPLNITFPDVSWTFVKLWG